MLLPGEHLSQRRALDHWLDRLGVRPRVVAELEDAALLMTFGAGGAGIFPAPRGGTVRRGSRGGGRWARSRRLAWTAPFTSILVLISVNLHEHPSLELGYSTREERPETDESENSLAACFGHDERFGGRLKQFVEYLASVVERGGHR